MKRSVGELNGQWALLFKINQVLMPIVFGGLVGLNVWFVKSIQTLDKQVALREAASVSEHALLKAEIKEWHSADLERRLPRQ